MIGVVLLEITVTVYVCALYKHKSPQERFFTHTDAMQTAAGNAQI